MGRKQEARPSANVLAAADVVVTLWEISRAALLNAVLLFVLALLMAVSAGWGAEEFRGAARPALAGSGLSLGLFAFRQLREFRERAARRAEIVAAVAAAESARAAAGPAASTLAAVHGGAAAARRKG